MKGYIFSHRINKLIPISYPSLYDLFGLKKKAKSWLYNLKHETEFDSDLPW